MIPVISLNVAPSRWNELQWVGLDWALSIFWDILRVALGTPAALMSMPAEATGIVRNSDRKKQMLSIMSDRCFVTQQIANTLLRNSFCYIDATSAISTNRRSFTMVYSRTYFSDTERTNSLNWVRSGYHNQHRVHGALRGLEQIPFWLILVPG